MSALKRREEPVEVNQEKMYELLVESSLEAMLVADDTGRIRFANTSAAQLFEYEKDEFLTLVVEDLLPLPLRSNHSKHRAHYHSNPVPRSMGRDREFRGVTKSGREMLLDIALHPFSSPATTFVSVAIVEIGERVESKRKLENSVKSLVEASEKLEQKIEERNEHLRRTNTRLRFFQLHAIQGQKARLQVNLIGKVAHELNTPLAAISASSGIVQTSLRLVWQKMAKVVEVFTPELALGFHELVAQTIQENGPRTGTKSRREIRQNWRQYCESHSLAEPELLAEVLTDLGLVSPHESWELILRAPEAPAILELATQLHDILSSAKIIDQATEKATIFVKQLVKSVEPLPRGTLEFQPNNEIRPEHSLGTAPSELFTRPNPGNPSP